MNNFGFAQKTYSITLSAFEGFFPCKRLPTDIRQVEIESQSGVEVLPAFCA